MEDSLFYKSPSAIIFSALYQHHSSTMMKRSLSTAVSSSSSCVVYTLLQRNPRSVDSIINLHSNRSMSSDCSRSFKHGDNVKDFGRGGDLLGTLKKIKVPESYSHRFRRNVKDLGREGDLAGTQKKIEVPESYSRRIRRKKSYFCVENHREWCGKQAQFKLIYGKPEDTTPMKEGRARHRQLEKAEVDSQLGKAEVDSQLEEAEVDSQLEKAEVSEKVVKCFKVNEDYWASMLLKFIICANQLSSKGLTHELPIIGTFEDVLIVGVIDEIRMPAVTETIKRPSLVEIKTRCEATLPHESQKRNGRLQLMCYKYLWDNAVTGNFPTDQFFNYLDLDPGYILSQDHQEYAAKFGHQEKTLEELVKAYRSKCQTLLPAHDQLILRYKYQKDLKSLGEVHFTYDSDWLKNQIKGFIKFMLGEQEPNYVSKEDRWKCDSCNFAAKCLPSKSNTNTSH